MRPFVAVDLETTGLDPIQHEIIEVGLVFEDRGWGVNEVEFSLPFDLELAEPEALEINGWGKRPFPEMRNAPDAARWLSHVLYDVHLVGKNPHFDEAFLRELLKKHGFQPTWHHRLVDVGALAWGAHNAAGNFKPEASQLQPPNVLQVAELTGIPITGQHAALADARWAYKVFRSIVPHEV